MKAIICFIVVLTFCTKLIQSSCLSYGHSCWGAHGKRSGISTSNGPPPADQWAIFKSIPDKEQGFHRQKNNEIPLEVVEKLTENLQKTLTPLLPVPRQTKREFPNDDTDRQLVFTPEEIMTARKLRFLDMLVNKDSFQFPRKKHA